MPLMIIGLFACTTVAGCGDGTPTADLTTDTTVTSTSSIPSKLAPPKQINRTGRPDVAFDPCLDIDDSVIEKAGFDPSTRERDDFISDDYAFLACEFDSPSLMLTISSSNLTLREVIERFGTEREIRHIHVNGRETLVIPDPRTDDKCDIYVETNVGFLQVILGFQQQSRRQGRQKCEGIVELATIFETRLP